MIIAYKDQLDDEKKNLSFKKIEADMIYIKSKIIAINALKINYVLLFLLLFELALIYLTQQSLILNFLLQDLLLLMLYLFNYLPFL